MSFDINATVAQMLQAIKDSVQNDWSKIKDSTPGFLEDRKLRLEILANQRLNKEIDDVFLKEQLQDEADVLKAELLALKIIAKATAQNAANAAIDVLTKAIQTAVGI
jgi:hypothetical protein